MSATEAELKATSSIAWWSIEQGIERWDIASSRRSSEDLCEDWVLGTESCLRISEHGMINILARETRCSSNRRVCTSTTLHVLLVRDHHLGAKNACVVQLWRNLICKELPGQPESCNAHPWSLQRRSSRHVSLEVTDEQFSHQTHRPHHLITSLNIISTGVTSLIVPPNYCLGIILTACKLRGSQEPERQRKFCACDRSRNVPLRRLA